MVAVARLNLPASDAGKRIWLTFDGAYRDTKVWVNGWLVSHHEGGYNSFREDITDVVRIGGRNTIAVRVDASKFEGWFYEGAGIYRHVWLDKTTPVAIAPDGVFVYSTFPNGAPGRSADIHVEAGVINSLTNASVAVVNCEIFSPEGKSVARFRQKDNVAGGAQGVIKLESKVSLPVLWSPESPKLYKLVTTVLLSNQVVDRQETAFGLRTFAFDATNGFLLNGHHYEIKGVCIHQDWAGVGIALPDSLQPFRIARLKEMGCNAIRTAHNPFSTGFLDACDRLGVLVLDEPRIPGSDSATLHTLADHIRRDRNHASVAFWSLGNEERGVQDTPQGANVFRSMQTLVKRLDPTRSVTYAAPNGNTFRGVNSVIDVRGWNYFFDQADRYHTDHPAQPEVCTEQGQLREHPRQFMPTTVPRLHQRLRHQLALRVDAALGRSPKHTVEFCLRPSVAVGNVRLGRVRLWRRAVAVGMAAGQLPVWRDGPVRISQGSFLLFPILVVHQHGPALASTLELARQGGPADSRGSL